MKLMICIKYTFTLKFNIVLTENAIVENRKKNNYIS